MFIQKFNFRWQNICFSLRGIEVSLTNIPFNVGMCTFVKRKTPFPQKTLSFDNRERIFVKGN